MPTYANNITQKAQLAAKAFLDGEDLSFITDEDQQIRTGIASDDLLLPGVVCQCAIAQSATPYEGNWQAVLRIEVRSNSTDTDHEEHQEYAGEVFSKFMDSPVNARQHLSSAAIEFTCQQLVPMQQGWELNDESWVSFLTLQIDCAGTYFDVT